MYDIDKNSAIGIGAVVLVLLTFILSVYSYNVRAIPLKLEERRQETQIKLACIAHQGTWASTDRDSRAPYSCSFK